MHNNKYKVEGSKILFEDSEIAFEYLIQEVMEIENMLIIYIDSSNGIINLEENVFGVSLKKKTIEWQIEKRNYPTGGYSRMKCPFVGISFHNNKLQLHNWCSTKLIVDPLTGKVLEEEETR